MKPISHVFD